MNSKTAMGGSFLTDLRSLSLGRRKRRSKSKVGGARSKKRGRRSVRRVPVSRKLIVPSLSGGRSMRRRSTRRKSRSTKGGSLYGGRKSTRSRRRKSKSRKSMGGGRRRKPGRPRGS